MDLRRRRDESDEGEESEGDDLRQLELDRIYNDQKLKNRFEHIFRKYGHDFEGVGDEIDIDSGDIVVDNGHLQHMRHEADPGKSASSRFVKTFKEKLEYEGESSSEEEDDSEEDDDDDEDENEDSGDDETSETPEYRHEREHGSSRQKHQGRLSPRKAMNAFGDLARPAPRLAHLLVGQETPQPAVPMNREHGNQDDSSIESTSGTSTPTNILSRLPGIQESMSALQPRAKRPAVDPEAIEALGVSIANQLAQLMAGPSKNKRKKKDQAKPKKVSKESIWDYPELGSKPRGKRRRSPSPVQQPLPSSPAPGSPGEESLWAPEGSVRPSKRPRRQREDDVSNHTPAVTRSTRHLPSSGNGTSKKDVKRCWNCSLTSTPSWQQGPHGQDLCESCARYYLHHRRMKPFDSPTPSAEGEDDEEERQVESQAQDARKELERRLKVSTALRPIAPASGSHFQQEDADETEDATHTQSQVQTKPYFYRPMPTQVPPPRTHARSPPRERARESLLHQREVEEQVPPPRAHARSPPRERAREPHLHQREAEEQAPQVSQSAPRSDATQTLASHRRHHPPEPPRQEDVGLANDNMNAPDLPDLDDQHHEESPDLRMLDNEQPHETPEPADSNVFALHDSGYAANTSRTLITSPGRRGRFTIEEDALIIKLKERDKLTWDAIAPYFPNRGPFAISGRYSRDLKFGQSHGRDYLEALEAQRAQEAEMTDEEDQLEDPVLREDLAWNEGQDELLLELREDQELEWEEISSLLPGHSPEAVEQRYELLAERGIEQYYQRHNPTPEPEGVRAEEQKARKPHKFSAEEDALVVRLKEVEGLTWSQVAQRFPGRPLHSIQRHYSRCLAPEVRKVTPTSKWDWVQGTMEDRILAVDPTLAGTPESNLFGAEEDESIRKLRENDGLSWDAIARQLPGRTANAVRHRYEYKFSEDAAKMRAERAERAHPKPTLPQAASLAAIPGMNVERWSASPQKASDPPVRTSINQTVAITPPQMRPIQPMQALYLQPSRASKPGPGSRTPFTRNEDDAILQLREMQGLSWEEIALRLPGRSVNSVSSRYAEVLRPTRVKDKKISEQPSQKPNALPGSSSQSSVQPLPQIAVPKQPASMTVQRDTCLAPSVAVADKVKTRPRTSLPATLPSASRPQNLLLRKALDNSLRRRSDVGSLTSTDPPVNTGENQTRRRHYRDTEAPSQQLFREMEMSLNTPSPIARLAKAAEQSQVQDDTLSESSDGGDSQMFDKLMHAATKFAIQQRNPALFNRVQEIYEKNPDDARLYQLLQVASNSSVTTADVLNAFESIVHHPAGNRDVSSNAETIQSPVWRHPRSGQTKIAPNKPLFGILYPTPAKKAQTLSFVGGPEAPASSSRRSKPNTDAVSFGDMAYEEYQVPMENDIPQASSLRRSRRAAADNASRKNAELFALPMEDLNETKKAPAQAEAIAVRTRRNSSVDEVQTADENLPPVDHEQHASEPAPRLKKPRGRPSGPLPTPNPSPRELIREAFQSSKSRAMPVQDIYTSIESDHNMRGNWKPRIRAELSQSPQFKRFVTDDGQPVWEIVDEGDETPSKVVSEAPQTSALRKSLFTSRQEIAPSQAHNETASESTSIVDDDDETIMVSVGPKQRRIVFEEPPKADVGAREKEAAPTEKAERAPKRRGRPPRRKEALSKSTAKETKVSQPATSRAAEIANSDEEEELNLDTSLEEPDELELPTERPSSRASRECLLFSDIYRDTISSNGAGPGVQSTSSKGAGKSKATALPSSSPLFMKPRTPASASYFSKKRGTPRPSSLRLSQLKKETPVRAQSPIFVRRSSSMASLKRFSTGKRLVETPVREVDSDEDELA